MTSSEKVMGCRTITLPNGLTINYAEFGPDKEEVVVFLHGYADSWRSFERLLRAFPSGYRYLALDLRGHGDSSKPAGPYTMEEFIGDIRMFLEFTGLEKVSLIGHSMGSLVGQVFAVTYPEMVDKLVLISSTCMLKENPVLTDICGEIMELQDPVAESFIIDFQTPSMPVPQEFMQSMIAESKKVPSHVWKTVFEEMLTVDTCEDLDRIQAETLILWGAEDALFTKSDQVLLCSKIKTCQFIEYKAGHALHWEIPGQVADDITRFLA